jgi:hypothetical protein
VARFQVGDEVALPWRPDFAGLGCRSIIVRQRKQTAWEGTGWPRKITRRPAHARSALRSGTAGYVYARSDSDR